jgi:hypothetical protein
MSRRFKAVIAAILGLAGTQAAAREPGTVFHRCSVQHRFTLPGAFGGPVRVASGPSGHVRTVEQADSAELINASIDVEQQGTMSGLSIAWAQNGFFGSPETGRRADLHPVFMQARFGGAIFWAPQEWARFDPAAMEIEITVASQRPIRHPLLFRLYRPEARLGLLTLGGPAELRYAGRMSASVRVLWRDLAAFADGRDRLTAELSNASGVPITRGTLDLAVLPRLIEHFRAAEAEVRALAPEAATRCERQVEPEVPDDATI